jgi:hypothetical protein
MQFGEKRISEPSRSKDELAAEPHLAIAFHPRYPATRPRRFALPTDGGSDLPLLNPRSVDTAC